MITWMSLIIGLAILTAWVVAMQAVCRPEPHPGGGGEPVEVRPPAAVTSQYAPPSDTLSRWQEARRGER